MTTLSASLRNPGIVLGLGFGGLFDGVLLHQVLQWHHMLSGTAAYPKTTLRGLEVNTFADGLFHTLTYVFLAAGLILLWRVVHEHGTGSGGRSLFGWVLVGWGMFNLIEGTVDHHILQIHHVRPGPSEALFDAGFLVLGIALVAAGLLLSARSAEPPNV